MMNEGLRMYIIECKWNDSYVQGVFTFTQTLNEWMDEVKEKESKGEFWGEQSSWVNVKHLVETSLISKRFLV